MKKGIKYSFIIFLLSGMVFSSFRVSINKMQCLGSGKISYSWFKADDCCPPEENKEFSMDADCCQFSKITFLSGISELLKQGFLKKIPFSVAVLSVKNLFHFSGLPANPSFLIDASPPLSCNRILSFFSIFRI